MKFKTLPLITSARLTALPVAIVSIFLLASPVSAQNSIGDREIVNEPNGAEQLRKAILRIGRRPTDTNALYDAGDAALKLGDANVALDFFERAERVSPSSGKVKAGLARTYLRLEKPVEALRLFDQSIILGFNRREIAFDRGLAYDLVGNFSRAQQEYEFASHITASDDLTIRKAISYALSGDIDQADSLLLPLLKANEPSAWRARSFLLAARGKSSESYKIALGFLNSTDAKNLRPYLKSMKKLTGAQQAAAIHFGHFPASNQIGRDSELIRSASNSSAPVTKSSDRLLPTGEPLGVKVAQKSKNKKSKKTKFSNGRKKPQNISPTAQITNVAQVKKEQVSKEKPAVPLTPKIKNLSSDKKDDALPNRIKAAPASSEPVKVAALNNNQKEAVFEQAAVTAPKKKFDLDSLFEEREIPKEEQNSVEVVDLEAIKREQKTQREAAKKKAEQDRARKALADKKEADRKKKIEEAKKAEAEKNRSRYWVQLATGRDASALKFDYRRISRKQADLFKGKSGATSKWGQTNRLVVGPFDTLSSAKKFESTFRKGGGDGFVWRSGNGTIVKPLP